MSGFGGLVDEIDARFSAGPKAALLVEEALRLVSGYPGGVSGFVRRLKAAGYTLEAASWLGGGDLVPLSGNEVEEILGCEAMARFAARAEVSQSFARTTLGYAIPNIVSLLAQRGALPARIRDSALRLIRTSTPRPTSHRTPNPLHFAARSGAVRGEDKSAAHLLATPVIPLATALIIGGSLFGYFIGTGDHGAAPSSPIAAQKPPVKSLSTESLLSPLPLGEMAAMFAPDAGRASAESSAAVSGLVGAGRASGPRLASDFPVIYFASGRAIIPAGDRNLVDQAARLVRQLPAGSLVEIAGYTDRTGIPAANLRLSQRRARAVLEALTRMGAAPARLTAKGYGVYVQTAARQTRALEGRSNAPAEDPQPGRRRVEFHVIHP